MPAYSFQEKKSILPFPFPKFLHAINLIAEKVVENLKKTLIGFQIKLLKNSLW
jgi:hypothetical protein